MPTIVIVTIQLRIFCCSSPHHFAHPSCCALIEGRNWKMYDVGVFSSDVSSNERTKCHQCAFRKAQSFHTKGYLTARFHPTRRFVKQQIPRKLEQTCEESETFRNAAWSSRRAKRESSFLERYQKFRVCWFSYRKECCLVLYKVGRGFT